MAMRLTCLRALAGAIGDRRGNALVEFSLVAPVLILLSIGALDYGLAYVESVRLSGAARAGVQQALYQPDDWQNGPRFEQAAIEEYAGKSLSSAERAALPVSATSSAFCGCVGGGTLGCSSSCPDGSSPARFVRVTLDRSMSLILPYPWADGSVDVTGEAVVRVR